MQSWRWLLHKALMQLVKAIRLTSINGDDWSNNFGCYYEIYEVIDVFGQTTCNFIEAGFKQAQIKVKKWGDERRSIYLEFFFLELARAIYSLKIKSKFFIWLLLNTKMQSFKAGRRASDLCAFQPIELNLFFSARVPLTYFFFLFSSRHFNCSYKLDSIYLACTIIFISVFFLGPFKVIDERDFFQPTAASATGEAIYGTIEEHSFNVQLTRLSFNKWPSPSSLLLLAMLWCWLCTVLFVLQEIAN